MDYEDYSTLTLSQPRNSLSSTSTLDSPSETHSHVMPQQSNIDVDRSITRTQSLRKRHYQRQKQIEHRISSHSTTATSSIAPSNITTTERKEEQFKEFSKMQRQQARPLGTCVRKCGQCRQLKHVLLAECSVCFRMIDVDLKDCRCQILTTRNVIDNFICSICNSELTLDGYIICANRSCQTTLSAMINKEDQENSRLSVILTNICYPKSAHRTVALQVNTLVNLTPLQRFLSTIKDDENEESSLLSWSKCNLDWTIITSSDSSDISNMSINSGVDASLKDIARNMTVAFNSNQPTNLESQSEDEQHQQSPLPSTNETTENNSPTFAEMPKSPRCLAIMNVRKRRDRLSTLVILQTNKACQTQLSCLADLDEMIRCEEVSNVTTIQTNNPTQIERQIQVNTIKGYFDDLSQVRIEITDRVRNDSTIGVTNDERILRALTERDGQRWSELVDQLISEQSNLSPSEIAQQLLDTIERLHTTEKLNILTTGQLQRKVRYAMSQFKHIDEDSHLRSTVKTTKKNRSGTNSRRSNDCNGRVDMAVTVRQVDKRHNHQSVVPADHNWKPYVDRLFDQGHSAKEIQRLLREAAETTMQSDDHRLQDVFDYINTKANQQRAKTAPTGIEFVTTSSKIKSVTRQEFQPTNRLQSIGNTGGIMTRATPSISERKMMSSKSNSPSALQSISSIKSPIIEQAINQLPSCENTQFMDLNKEEKERSSSLHSSANQEHGDITANPSVATIDLHQSVTSTEITIQRERNNDKKSDTSNVIFTDEQTASKIQEEVKPKTSQASDASNFYKPKSPSTTSTIPLINLEKKCIYALHRVQNALGIVNNNNIRLHPHPSNIQFDLNKLIGDFESILHKPDNANRDDIEYLLAESIELLNNERNAIASQLNETNFRNLDDEISNALHLLQEYQEIVIPITLVKEDLALDQHTSNTVVTPSDALVPLERVEENTEPAIESKTQAVQLLSNSTLDLKQPMITSEYQETASLIRCRTIPYTSSNEQRSTETLKQVLISSTEHIPQIIKNLTEQSAINRSDPNLVTNTSSKTENELLDGQSQNKWLGSLLSKISDNISSTLNISSSSPSLQLVDGTKIDQNDKQEKEQRENPLQFKKEKVESVIMKIVDEQPSSISIHQNTTNVLDTTDDSQNTLDETNVITLEEEHTISFIVPGQDIFMIGEQFQIAQAKLSQKQSVEASKHLFNSKESLTPAQDENINQQPSNSDFDSTDRSQNSLSVTAIHTAISDEKQQFTSSISHDDPQLIINRSSSTSDIDISQQPDQLQAHEDTTSQVQSLISSASASEEKLEMQQKPCNTENEEKISPTLVPTEIPLSKTDSDIVPKTTKELPSSKDHEKDEKTASVSSFPPNEKDDRDIIKTNESHRDIGKTSRSLNDDTQVFDKHASEIFNHQNKMNKLQLPISAQHFSIPNAILSNSVLNHLNDHDDTISSNDSMSSVPKRLSTKKSSTNSDEDEKSSSGKKDIAFTNEFHTPIMISPTHSIAQQLVNTVLSPSPTAKTENVKYKKLTASTPLSLEAISSPTAVKSEDDALMNQHTHAPYLLVEEPSGSVTPLIEAQTTDDDGKSLESMPSTYDRLVDDRLKEVQKNNLNRGEDVWQDEHTDPPGFSNTSMEESSSFDDTARTPPSQKRSKENLMTDKIDDQQPKTQLTITKTFSRPKITIEDAQTPLISTPHSSIVSTTFNGDTQSELKQRLEEGAQFNSEDTEPSNMSSSSTLNEEEQPNETSNRSVIKAKSFSEEKNSNTVFENITGSEHAITNSDKPKESSLVHPSFQLRESNQDEAHQLEKKNLSKNESLVSQSPPLSNKQSSMDNRSETNDILDQPPSPLPARRDDKISSHIEQHRSSVNLSSTIKRADSISPMIIKKAPISSTTTAVLPSSIMNITTHEQEVKSRVSLSERENDQLTSEEIQGPISVSSFNLAHLVDPNPGSRLSMEGEELLSMLGKSSTGDSAHHTNSKQQSTLTNTSIRGGVSSPAIPKLLLKRSSLKQTSTTAQSIKPIATLSITDVSTSSSNTVITDHLLSTRSSISDQEGITSIKKISKGNISKDGYPVVSDVTRKPNTLKKTSQNQPSLSSNKKIEAPQKKFTNNSLLANFELAYDNEATSDAWMKSHDSISEILIIDEQDEKTAQTYERKLNKPKKTRMIDGSRLMPFNLKARGDHQAHTVDSSRLPSIEQSCGEHHMKKWSHDLSRRPIIRLPVTQIEKFACGTIGPRLDPSSIAHQLFSLPSIHERQHLSSQIHQTTESLTDRFYSHMSAEDNDDDQAFESILNWQQQYPIPKTEQNKLQYMYLLDISAGNTTRGRQYPLLTDEIDMIDDPNACTIVNKWAFADLVNAERQKFIEEPIDNLGKPKKRLNSNKNFKICIRKRPLTKFEQNIFKEVDIISIVDPQTIFLHIPSITIDNQVFIKNRKFKCNQTFDENCQISTIYHSTLAPLLDMAIDGSKCLCLISGGKYSGKNYLLHSLIDLFSFDLIRLLSTFDIYIKLLGICHNRIVDLLQNNSPIRLIKSMNWTLIPNDEFHLENDNDIDYITCQIKKRRRFIHQVIQINFCQKDQSIIMGSLMIVMLASSQYVHTRNLCSHRRKFLINSLNRTMLSFKRALLGIRQNPDRVRAAFNNDILTRLIQPYVFDDQSNVCYIGTLNPGHRHRRATKSTLEFARNLRFCLKRINKQRRKKDKLSQSINHNDELDDNIL